MLEAKASLVTITNFWQTTVVPRLGMPSMVLSGVSKLFEKLHLILLVCGGYSGVNNR